MKKFVALVLLVALIVSAFAVADAGGVTKYVVDTKTEPLNVRAGPGTDYEVFATFRKGTVIDVAGSTNGWAAVLHDFGYGYGESIGYVDASYLKKYTGEKPPTNNNASNREKISTEGTTAGIVNTNMMGWLNVRKSDSKNAKTLGRLYAGDKVYVVSQFGDWAKIVYNGRYAYVMTKFITGNFESNLPVEGELFKVVVRKNTKLNVRAGSSKDFDIVERLRNGAYIKVIEVYDEWSKVYYNASEVGYVMNEFIVKLN